MSQENQSKKILIIDDEPSIRQLMELWLREKGYEAIAVASGRMGVETAQKDSFLVVLLDIGLKDIRGTEVLRSLKENQPELPIIMLTGYHDETEARRAVDLGALAYITKPIDFEYLKQVIDAQAA